jgi:hypothetical protein
MFLEPPDAETIAMFRRLLASPNEGHQESTIMQALEIADQAASVVWERAGDKTPAARAAGRNGATGRHQGGTGRG